MKLKDFIPWVFDMIVIPIGGLYLIVSYAEFLSQDILRTIIGFLFGYPATILFLTARGQIYQSESKTIHSSFEWTKSNGSLTIFLMLLLGVSTNRIVLAEDSLSMAINVIVGWTIVFIWLYLGAYLGRRWMKDAE